LWSSVATIGLLIVGLGAHNAGDAYVFRCPRTI